MFTFFGIVCILFAPGLRNELHTSKYDFQLVDQELRFYYEFVLFNFVIG